MLTRVASVLFFPLGWIIYFFSNLSPRDPATVVFGVQTNAYSGNVKALFENESLGLNKIFISRNRNLARQLRQNGRQAYWRFSARAIMSCLKAGSFVYSSYPSDINFWLSGNARLINVWHGTPLKTIERDVKQGRYSYRNRYPAVYRLIAPHLLEKPDVLLVSSPYEEQCFQTAFSPPVDCLLRAYPPRLEPFISSKESKSESGNILYAPTWRDDHSFELSDYLDLTLLNEQLKDRDLKFVIKRHPSDRSAGIDIDLSNILEVSKDDDIYRHLENADLLVTDYSSMLFEAYYAGIPAVIYAPDLSHYSSTNREFYTDLKSLPFPVALDQQSLIDRLSNSAEESEARLHNVEIFGPYPVRNNLLKELVVRASQ